MLLGTLTRELDALHIYSPQPVAPFLGFSFEATARLIRAFRSPSWFTSGGRYMGMHKCSLQPRINEIIEDAEGRMGLTLENYL